MWGTLLTGFAYLDIGLTILATYLILPIVLVYLGIIYLHKHYIKFAKRTLGGKG